MATPYIAFDPLQTASASKPVTPLAGTATSDSRIVSLSAGDLPQELRLSLESSLEALAQEDASAAEPGEVQTALDGFDLDEVGGSDAAVTSRQTGKGSQKLFSFDMRNVVMACGLVTGSLVLLWTHGLVSSAADSGDISAPRAGTPRLVVPRAPDSQLTNPVALEPQTVPPPLPATTSNEAPTIAAFNAASQANGTADSIEPTPLATLAGTPLKPVQSLVTTRDLSVTTVTLPKAEQKQENANAAPNDDTTLASRNGSPFNPTYPARSFSAPVVALPTTDSVSLGNNAQMIPLPSPETTASDDNKTGRQRSHLRPRGAERNNQPGFPTSDPFSKMRVFRMRRDQSKKPSPNAVNPF